MSKAPSTSAKRDAVWESEPNAFSDLYERRIHCDAPVCKCLEGRKHDDLGSKWEILLCDLCGTTGVHIVCGKLAFTCTKWNCSSCLEMLEESEEKNKGLSIDKNIRTKEESGGELSESEMELKNFALLAQGIMSELQMTESEILNLANNISKETLAKSDISRFFRYNLTIKKMRKIRNLLESVFAARRAIIKSAQNSSRKKKSPKVNKNDSPPYAKPKEKDVISQLRGLHSSENIDVIPSVTTKKTASPLKSSNKKKSSVGASDSEKGKSFEELEKNTSEEIPSKSPEKGERATGYGVALLPTMFGHHSHSSLLQSIAPISSENGEYQNDDGKAVKKMRLA